jgi:hypothetical protein
VADRLVVKAGRMVRQTGPESRTGKGPNREDMKKENNKGRSTGIWLVDLEHTRRTGTERKETQG